jgi:rhomboid protease GluP
LETKAFISLSVYLEGNREGTLLRITSHRFSPTLVLVVANIAFYGYTSLIGKSFVVTSGSVLAIYGQYNYAILHWGYWWQLFTSMFVHVNIAHIAGNMFFLLIFGLRAEEFFTDAEYYFLYLTSGLAGNLLSLAYLFYPTAVTSAGASGAIFGVFGAVIIFMRRVIGGSVIGALLFAFMFFVITLSSGTNFYAHFGGLLTGLVIGYILASSRKAFLSRKLMG